MSRDSNTEEHIASVCKSIDSSLRSMCPPLHLEHLHTQHHDKEHKKGKGRQGNEGGEGGEEGEEKDDTEETKKEDQAPQLLPAAHNTQRQLGAVQEAGPAPTRVICI